MPAGESREKIKVLFVCTGNTCRSPLAEVLLRERISQEKLERLVEVSSAGLIATVGAPASAMAVRIAADNGLELSSHRSRQLTEEMFSGMDLVVGMQPGHLFALEPLQSDGKPELRLLVEFCESEPDGEGGIPDPFGGSREAYEQAFAKIARCIDGLTRHIRDRLGGDSGKPRK